MSESNNYFKPQDLLGKKISQYRIERIVGRGGMGTVYEALESSLDRKVALKVLSPEASTTRETVGRFKREAKVLAQIEHPNVIRIYQMGRVGSVIFIAQEYVEGTDYETIVEEDGPLDLWDAMDVVESVAMALGAVHDVGVIHRDLKPSNVMRRADGRIKVLDFGIAKPFTSDAGPEITQTGMFLGTLGYCSPEQIRGDKLTVRSDIYSLGVMFYFLLTGDVPNAGAATEEMLQKTLTGKLMPLRKRRSDLAHPLVHLVERMVHSDAKRRPGSAAVVRSRILEIREFLEANARRTGPAARKAGKGAGKGLLEFLKRIFGR